MYEVIIPPAVAKQLRKLRGSIYERILDALDKLEQEPRPAGYTKLAGADLYRIRVGDYRILYAIEDLEKRVRIFRVAHRRDAYR